MAAKTFDIYMLYHRNLVLPTEKFYVYIHKNPLTQKIFYVGSAQGKTDLYLYCAENYNLSRHMVNMLIETEESYRGAKIKARGLKIIREGKEHI